MNLFGLTIEFKGKNGNKSNESGLDSRYVRIPECMRVHATLDKNLDDKFKSVKEHIDMQIGNLKEWLHNNK